MDHVIGSDPTGRWWSVRVDGGTASLSTGGVRRRVGPEAATVRVPVGDLLAAVGAAWQDDVGGPRHGWCPVDDDVGFEEGLDDLCRREPDPDDPEWGDADPDADAFAHPPPPPPRPPEPDRRGVPWSDEEERLRALWLAADPCADRDAVLASVAEALERQVASIRGRLEKVGCHDTLPGVTLEGAREVAVRLAAERSATTGPTGPTGTAA